MVALGEQVEAEELRFLPQIIHDTIPGPRGMKLHGFYG